VHKVFEQVSIYNVCKLQQSSKLAVIAETTAEMWRYGDFSIFQNSGRRHLWFLKLHF